MSPRAASIGRSYRNRVSIMRPFDDKDLREPLEPELVKELEWQSDMAERTKKLYRF